MTTTPNNQQRSDPTRQQSTDHDKHYRSRDGPGAIQQSETSKAQDQIYQVTHTQNSNQEN